MVLVQVSDECPQCQNNIGQLSPTETDDSGNKSLQEQSIACYKFIQSQQLNLIDTDPYFRCQLQRTGLQFPISLIEQDKLWSQTDHCNSSVLGCYHLKFSYHFLLQVQNHYSNYCTKFIRTLIKYSTILQSYDRTHNYQLPVGMFYTGLKTNMQVLEHLQHLFHPFLLLQWLYEVRPQSN